MTVYPFEGDLLSTNLNALRVVVELLAVFGAEDKPSLVRVQVSRYEVLRAERGEDIVELGIRGFVECGNALSAM